MDRMEKAMARMNKKLQPFKDESCVVRENKAVIAERHKQERLEADCRKAKARMKSRNKKKQKKKELAK